MSLLFRSIAVMGALLFFTSIAQAQFVSEDDIPLEVQTQIIEQIVAEHGHLDIVALEQAFREWVLSQPLPDADGQMVDSGLCGTCEPPTDNEDPDFPPVRDIRIVTRTRPNGMLRRNFTVRWRRPVRLPRAIRGEYELDHYEVFLSRDDGTFEQHVIGKQQRADGTEKLPRRIRFRRRDQGQYSVSVRPVYLPVEEAEQTAPVTTSDGIRSATPLTQSSGQLTSGVPATRMLSSGLKKGPGSSPPVVEVGPDSTVNEAFISGAIMPVNSNQALYDCIVNAHSYTGGTQIGTISVLNCADEGISSVEELEHFAGLVTLNLGNLDGSTSNNNSICDISKLEGLDNLTSLTLSGNTTFNHSSCTASLARMQELRYLFLEDINLAQAPVLSLTADYLSVSLANNLLGNGGYSCDGANQSSITASFFNLSNNQLTDSDLPILEDITVTNLDLSGNRFDSMQPSSNCPDNILNADILNASGNQFPFSAGANLDLRGYQYTSFDLSNAVNMRQLSANLPEVCFQLNLQGNDQWQNFSGNHASNSSLFSALPAASPHQIFLPDANTLSCQDQDTLISWWQQTPRPGECFIRPVPIFDSPSECRAGQVKSLTVGRNEVAGHHVLNWEGLGQIGAEHNLVYEVDKRLAGFGHPSQGSNNTGVIGEPYVYSGSVGGAVVSDLSVSDAYEFRIRLCNLDNQGGFNNGCGEWSSTWVEGAYPLTRVVNANITWLEIGDNPTYQLSWTYPQSFFFGNPPGGFAIYDNSGNLVESINAGSSLPSIGWQSSILSLNNYNMDLNIRTCRAPLSALDCDSSDSVMVLVNEPAEVSAELLIPTDVGSDVSASNHRFNLHVENRQPGSVSGETTLADYYEIIETSNTSQDMRTHYHDISDQFMGQDTIIPIYRQAAGNYDYQIRTCIRNRNGADVCSEEVLTLDNINVPATPGYNSIQESLCFHEDVNGNNGVGLQWTYETDNPIFGDDDFDIPDYYYIESAFGTQAPFYVEGGELDNFVTEGLNGASLNTLSWNINACQDNDPNNSEACQHIGFINTGAPPPTNRCSNSPPQNTTVETRSQGGPADLRPGYWTNQESMPRQGWAFYWASDLRYENVHEEYGDTYDLLAYWSTYRRINGRWSAVWLYSELIQRDNNECSDGRLSFGGALFYPQFNTGREDMDVGFLSVCFDPETNTNADVIITSNLDKGLESPPGGFRADLSQITDDNTAFPNGEPTPNPHDYLNGSYRFDGRTKVVSWTSGYLEAEVIHGFDTLGEPIWINGIINCNDPAHANECDGTGVLGRPKLADASLFFQTAEQGIDPFNSSCSASSLPNNCGDYNDVQSFSIDPNGTVGINTVKRDKSASANSVDEALGLTGELSFTITNQVGGTLRQVMANFGANNPLSNLRRESNFHDIRYLINNDPTEVNPQSCTLSDSTCTINMSWFSDADFIGGGIPSIEPFYGISTDGGSTWTDAHLSELCESSSGPVPDGFVVQDYDCIIATPGLYRFMLLNRVNNGQQTNDSNVIAITNGQLTINSEGTTNNDNLGVAVVGDAPQVDGVTVHDHSLPHDEEIGVLAGEAGVSGGAASYSIPINIPPGRQGMQPSVSLSYNSRAGNGTVGMGWSLSAGSAISRCPSTVAQDGFGKGVTYTDTDRLCLDGQRLMVVTGSYWAPDSTYRTEIDSFVRVQLNGSGAADSGCDSHFEVRGKDNIIRTYGTLDNQQVQPEAVDASNNICVTNSWLLAREKDPSNNTVDYDYSPYGDGEQLLDRIAYTGKNNTPGNREVRFEYQARTINGVSDLSTSYLAGYRSEQTRRLNNIKTFVGSDQVRQYNLVHATSSATNRLLLTSVEECAYSGNVETACLPETDFSWGDQSPFFDWQPVQTNRGTGFENITSVDPLTVVTDSGGIQRPNAGALEQLFDLDGDGSRELFFTVPKENDDLPADQFIISVDAEGNERWRASTEVSTVNTLIPGNNQVILSGVDSNQAIDERVADLMPVVEGYVDSLDLSTQFSNTNGRSATSAELEALRITMMEEVSGELGEFLRIRGLSRAAPNSVDFDDDGITDMSGFRPAGGDSPDMVFSWFIRQSTNITNGSFDQLFEIRPSNIVVTPGSISTPRAHVADVNNDGHEDVLIRVEIPVTDADGDEVITSGLQLWLYAGVSDTDNSIVYVLYNGAAEIDPILETIANGVDVNGVIYIWPYNVFLTGAPDEDNEFHREIATGVSFSDVNGDGLQDIVINSQLLDLTFTAEFADYEPLAIFPSGFSDASARVLLNQSMSATDINFNIVEYSVESTVTDDLNARGQQSLGLYTDSRQTYQLSMDINSDGLVDSIFVPNRHTQDAFDNDPLDGLELGWYVQINQGRPNDSATQTIYSDPIRIIFPIEVGFATEINTPNSAVIGSPVYGNLISPIDWDNDGETELMIPQALEMPICVSRLNRTLTVPGGGNSEFGIHCPTSITGEATDGEGVEPRAGTMGVGDATSGDIVIGNPHYVGFGHLDRSIYQMGILEFGEANFSNETITVSLLGYESTGLLASARSTVDDSRGDGITDLFTIHGCQQDIDSAPEPLHDPNLGGKTRCLSDSTPPGYGVEPFATWWQNTFSQADRSDALVNRGYYTSSNIQSREQVLDLMLSVTDGFNNQSSWSYAPLSSNPPGRQATDIPLYVVPDRSLENEDGYVANGRGEYFYFSSSMYVVSYFDQSNGLTNNGTTHLQNRTYYGYEEAVFNSQGRGFQGFRKVISEQVTDNLPGQENDSGNDLRSVSIFHQIFPLAGRMQASYTQRAITPYFPEQDRLEGQYRQPDSVIDVSGYVWDCRDGLGQLQPGCNIISQLVGAQAQIAGATSHGIYHPVLTQMTSDQYEINPTPTAQLGRYAKSSVMRAYDEFGNVLSETNQLDNYIDRNFISFGDLSQSSTTDITYINDASSNWWLGQMQRSVTTTDVGYSGAFINAEVNAPINETEKITTQLMGYDTDLRKPVCQVVATGDVSGSCSSFDIGIWQRTSTVFNTTDANSDNYGNVETVTVNASDLNGQITPRITSMGYTTDGYFPLTVTNAAGHVVTTRIEPREGNPTRVIDANDLVTLMDYDVFGRETETWYPLGSTGDGIGPDQITSHYAPRSSTRYTASCLNSATATAYCMHSIADGAPIVVQSMDSLNRAIRVQSNGFVGRIQTNDVSYNGRGQMVSDTVPRYIGETEYSNEYRYDALGRMIYKDEPRQTNNPDTNATQSRYTHYVHDGLSTVITMTGTASTPSGCDMGTNLDNNTVCVQRSYATNGWLMQTRDGHNMPTNFWYDGQGSPIRIHDAFGNPTTAVYNDLGHRNGLQDPNMGNWAYQYNGLGEVVEQTDANQQTFTFDYDLLGRLAQRTASGWKRQ